MKSSNTIIAEMSHGLNGKITREIKKVQFWQGVTFVTKPATADLVSMLLIKSNHEKSNAIVTSEGLMYVTSDTPGYCDGELTIKRMIQMC